MVIDVQNGSLCPTERKMFWYLVVAILLVKVTLIMNIGFIFYHSITLIDYVIGISDNQEQVQI